MKGSRVFAGQMSSRVEVFGYETQYNGASEAIDTEVSHGKRFVERVQSGGNVEIEGGEVSMAFLVYRMRFDRQLFSKSNQLFVRDFDGDWDVVSVNVLDGRNRYMQLKCKKRER